MLLEVLMSRFLLIILLIVLLIPITGFAEEETTPPADPNSFYSGRVTNDQNTISSAADDVKTKFVEMFGREPSGGEAEQFVSMIVDNYGTTEEILAMIETMAAECGGENPASGAWPRESGEASRDGIDARFYRSGDDRVDEEKNYTYECSQGDVSDPVLEVEKAIAAINDAVSNSGGVGGVFGEGPVSGSLKFKWSVKDPQDNSIGNGSGSSFQHRFTEPSEPQKCTVKHKINYEFRQFIVSPL
jgi:hypothetical protein